MTRTKKGQEVIPSARRLTMSLRDLGYDFVTAVADLVDNSIEAGSSVVNIDVEFNGDNSWVRVADNGKGMRPNELKEAMRYGSEREYDGGDLGKFGLGLKTASTSQCRKLSVASRTNKNRSVIVAYCWDVEHVEKINRWEIIPLSGNQLAPSLREPLDNSTGTVVLWEHLDRILGYKFPYGETARKKLLGMCRDLEQHLAMVFHRFIIGEVRKRKLKITLNGNDIKPWDPFARSEPKTKKLPPTILKVQHERVRGEVRLEPYVLPNQSDFSSPEAFRRASGPAKWNQQQGFYVYRANRLIQSGGWCRLRTSDEHTKLARVALSFYPVLDDAFKINVAKMRIQLPSQIREQVEGAIEPVLKLADSTYRKGNKPGPNLAPIARVTSNPAASTGLNQDQAIEPGATVQMQPLSEESTEPAMWTLDDIQNRLENIATLEEKFIIQRVFTRFRKRLSA